MEKTPFFDILVQSWNLSFSKSTYFFFGFFVALPVASQFLLLPEQITNVTMLKEIIFASPGTSFLFFSSSFLFILFGKSNLIERLSLTHGAEGSPRPTPPRRSPWDLTKKMFLLETSFGVFLLSITLILAIPSAISLVAYQRIPEALSLLGLGVFIPVVIMLFFVRQFSYYYFLLSPLRLKSAIERGTALFIRYRSPTFLFGMYYFFLTSIFTFSLNLAMLGGVVLFWKFFGDASKPILSFVGSLFFLSWFAVFKQALWFRFFMSLAGPKPAPQEDGVLIKEHGAPETPSA
jgi:hypothetical protein